MESACPMVPLADLKCVPCKGGTPPLKGQELEKLAARLRLWNVVDEHHLSRTFRFPDFVSALAFVNRLGAVAEEQQHHPNIFLTWGKVTVEVHTHKINALTESDFILAAKIDRIAPEPA